VVRRDVPAGALAVSSGPQREIRGWTLRKRAGTPMAAAAEAAARVPADEAAAPTPPDGPAGPEQVAPDGHPAGDVSHTGPSPLDPAPTGEAQFE
jgi:hypothetical protein